MVVVCVHVMVVPGGNLLNDCWKALDMKAEPSPPGCFNSLGVIVGSWALAVLGGGVVSTAVFRALTDGAIPSSMGLPGLGGVGGGVGGCGVVVGVG